MLRTINFRKWMLHEMKLITANIKFCCTFLFKLIVSKCSKNERSNYCFCEKQYSNTQFYVNYLEEDVIITTRNNVFHLKIRGKVCIEHNTSIIIIQLSFLSFPAENNYFNTSRNFFFHIYTIKLIIKQETNHMKELYSLNVIFLRFSTYEISICYISQ